MSKQYYRASCYSIEAGCKQHGIMVIEGDTVTMLPDTYTNKQQCVAAIDKLRAIVRMAPTIFEQIPALISKQ